MKLNVSEVFLRRLPDLGVLEGQLGPILDEEGHQDGPVLPVGDVVRADQRIEKHRDGLQNTNVELIETC